MANEEQLRILKQGVEVWNNWRKRNRHIKINLRGANLSRKNLEGADFREADIQGTNFTNAFLQGTNFSQSKAGLQKQWIIGLVCIPFLLSGLLGFLLRFFCIYISNIAFDDLTIYFPEPPTDLVIFFARIFAGSISVAVGLTLALGPGSRRNTEVVKATRAN